MVHFLAAHPTTVARSDPGYRATLNRGDLNLPDGMAVAWAARLLGHSAPRLAGTEGLNAVAAWGTERGLRHYLFGATPEVLASMERELAKRYPGIVVVGTESPPFREMSDEELASAAERMRLRTSSAWGSSIMSARHSWRRFGLTASWKEPVRSRPCAKR